MDNLFRFVALRAPRRTAPDGVVDLTAKTGFQRALLAIHAVPTAPPAGTPAHLPTVETRAARARALMVGRAAAPSRGAQPPTVAQPDPVTAARTIAEQFVNGAYGPGFIADTLNLPGQVGFDRLYIAAQTAKKAADLETAIQAGFGIPSAQLVADPAFKALMDSIRDSIVAAIIHPAVHSLPMADLARLARLGNLIARVAAADPTLDVAGAIQSALNATLLLPQAIFPLRDDLPQPVGVGDLLVVKQQLKRYELGDIANIENILKGEKRDKTLTHTQSQPTRRSRPRPRRRPRRRTSSMSRNASTLRRSPTTSSRKISPSTPDSMSPRSTVPSRSTRMPTSPTTCPRNSRPRLRRSTPRMSRVAPRPRSRKRCDDSLRRGPSTS